MEKTNYWSGMKPAVEDLQFDQTAKENAIKERFKDAFRQGVIPGVGNELEVTVPDPSDHTQVQVGTGEAYIDGEKVKVTSVQTVTLDDVATEDNIIWIQYTTQDGDYREHYITGDQYPCRKYDSFILGATRESLFDPTGKLQLAKASIDQNNNLYVIDLRESLQLKSALLKDIFADETPPTDPSNVNISTGMVKSFSSVNESAYGEEITWVKVTWDASTDETGIAYYKVVWIPKDIDTGTDQPDQRIEVQISLEASPDPRTEYTFYGIPPGQRGYVKVKAVDRAGNESNWVSSAEIIAGFGPAPPDPPALDLISTYYGVELVITAVSDAKGYEVYVRKGSWPQIGNNADLFYKGSQLRHQIAADVGEEVYIRVRSYGEGGQYSSTYSEAHERSGRSIITRVKTFEVIVKAWESYP